MKIGLYGGTFDPIHHGHLILGREALEKLAMDRIVFIPASLSPHKLETQPSPPELRMEMIRLSIENEPGFETDDLELHRNGPSYAVETVEVYRKRFPGAQLFYLIGQDNLTALHTWRRVDDLLKNVTLVVFGRGSSSDSELAPPNITRTFDISSTEIRNRVAKGLSIRYLVHHRVANLIHEKQLYLEPRHRLINDP